MDLNLNIYIDAYTHMAIVAQNQDQATAIGTRIKEIARAMDPHAVPYIDVSMFPLDRCMDDYAEDVGHNADACLDYAACKAMLDMSNNNDVAGFAEHWLLVVDDASDDYDATGHRIGAL